MSEYATYFFFILRRDADVPGKMGDLLKFSHYVEGAHQITLFEYRDYTDKSSFTHIPKKRIKDIDGYLSEVVSNMRQSDKAKLALTYLFEEKSNLDIDFNAMGRSIIFSINNGFFNYDYFRETNKRIEAFLGFCKAFYRHFSPVYGYGITEINDWTSPGRLSEIDQLQLSTLYCYNFLGPELTTSIGMDLLNRVPKWKGEDMGDGGIFLAMEENPISPERSQENYAKAIEMLKIPRFKRAG